MKDDADAAATATMSLDAKDDFNAVRSSSSNNNITNTKSLLQSVTCPEGFEWDSDWKIVAHSAAAAGGSNGGSNGSPVELQQNIHGNSNANANANDENKYGWEYYNERRNYDDVYEFRKRRWLRSIKLKDVMVEEEEGEGEVHGDVLVDGSLSTVKQASKVSTRMNNWKYKVQEQYNWKGFSFALYKSLIWRNSAGLMCKVPLATNFDFIERR